MIRLRRLLERGRAHPVLGPLVVIVLVLVLAMVFVHAAHDGHETVADLGAICVGLVTFLGVVLLERLRRCAPAPVIAVRGDRGPPRRVDARRARRAAFAVVPLHLPLRR